MGLIGGADYTVTGIRQMSLLPALAGLILGLGALMFAWRREGRKRALARDRQELVGGLDARRQAQQVARHRVPRPRSRRDARSDLDPAEGRRPLP
jgi:hypothetical protein